MASFLKKYITLLFLSFFPKITEVLAAEEGGGVSGKGVLTNPLGTTDIMVVLEKIVDFLIVLGAPLLVIFIIIGGFQILTAAGSPEKINTGKKTILYASIGYAIVLCAWGIIAIIKQTLGFKG